MQGRTATPALSPSSRPPGGGDDSALRRASTIVPAHSKEELTRRRFYDPGLLRQLTNELERRYDMPELMELCQAHLNLVPSSLGGTNARAAFARALVEEAVEQDSIWVLLDALRQRGGSLHPLLQLHISAGLVGAPAVEQGDRLGEYLLLRELERDELAAHFWARQAGKDYRLQVLGYHASMDSGRLQRLRLVLRQVRELQIEGIEQEPSLEHIGGLMAVASRYTEGLSLADRIARSGTMSFVAARRLFRRILHPLVALHHAGVVHGQLCSRNVLLTPNTDVNDGVVLLGTGRNWLWDGTLGHVPMIALAPELLKGKEPTPATDVYGFAALVYEVITGRPVFAASGPQELATSHLSTPPPMLRQAKGVRHVPPALDQLFQRCLSKDPGERPRDAGELLNEMQQTGSVSGYPKAVLRPAEVEERLLRLRENPGDRRLLAEVIDAVQHGADARAIADELWMIAHRLDASNPQLFDVRCRLLEEAAQVYSGPAAHPAGAEVAYRAVLQLHPGDEAVTTLLAQIYQEGGQPQAVVELLESQAKQAKDGAEGSRLWARAGTIWETELADPERALAAFIRAFTEAPERSERAGDIERLASKVHGGWNLALQGCVDFTGGAEGSGPAKIAVLQRMARWYDKLSRPEASEQCYRTILELEPGHREAFEGLTGLLRRTQRWQELTQELMGLAEGPDAAPAEARDLLAEAASIFAERLGAEEAAVHLFQRVVELDPGHETACDGLARYYQRHASWHRYAELLTQRGFASRGERRHALLCQAGEVYETRLNDDEAALQIYRGVLDETPGHLESLQGLERVLTKVGRFQELVDALMELLDDAVTPRQEALLWDRVAALYENEYLDADAAIKAYQRAIELDPKDEQGVAALARLYTAAGDWENLIRVHRKLWDLHEGRPEHVGSGLLLADLLAERLEDFEAAAQVLERLLELHPDEAEVMSKLGEMRMRAGDVDAGLLLLDDLATQIADPSEKAAHLYSVGRLLERDGYLEEAVERYKFALDANPGARGIAVTLREAYAQMGDHAALFELLKSDLVFISGTAAQAKRYAELARLALDQLQDDERAEQMAVHAEALDSTSMDANYVLGTVAFRNGRYGEAVAYLQRIAGHFERGTPRGLEALCQYAMALSECGRSQLALQVAEELLQIAPEDVGALCCAAGIVREHGDAQRAVQILRVAVAGLSEDTPAVERADLLCHLGTAAMAAAEWREAIAALRDAVATKPDHAAALNALSTCYEHEQEWQAMADTLYAELEFSAGPERLELLTRLGDVAYQHLGDPEYAARNYLIAHRESPTERRLLVKLLHVYTDMERWPSLISVILKLVELLDESSDKARYLRVASLIAGRKLHDTERSSRLVDRALEYEPEHQGLLESALQLSRESGDGRRLEDLLKREIRIASKTHDKARMMSALGELADVYLNTLGRVHQAIAVHEGALELDPDNEALQEYLTQAYTNHPERYAEKAIMLHQRALDKQPMRQDSYRALRDLYTRQNNADASWCVSRALTVLELASAEEQEFFERLRTGRVAVASTGLDPGEWSTLLLHPDCEGPLTGVLVAIHSAVVAASSHSLEELGLSPPRRVNAIGHPAPVLGSLAYIADVLGVPVPEVLLDPRSSDVLAFLPAPRAAFVAGKLALSERVDVQQAAFLASRAIARTLPGLGLHGLCASSSILKTWLLAGIRLVHPQFGVPQELAEAVDNAEAWLKLQLNASQQEQLLWGVNKLLKGSPALDLRKWACGVEYTSDRLGLLFADDLDVAVQGIRRGEAFTTAAVDDRLAAICRYSVSDAYFAARERLGIRIS